MAQRTSAHGYHQPGQSLPGQHRLGRFRRLAAGAALALAFCTPASASNYFFLPAPEITLNRVYRVDKATGEVGACQYGLREGSELGVTLCYQPGDGAGPQPPGEYALMNTRHEKEGGVFRINLRDGAMSICFVLQDKVVCTPPAR